MSVDYQIRECISDYLLGESTIGDFQQRVIPLAWEAAEGTDAKFTEQAAELVGRIELSLAEYTNGHLDEEKLRSALLSLLYTYRVGPPPPIRTASSSPTLWTPTTTGTFNWSTAAGTRP